MIVCLLLRNQNSILFTNYLETWYLHRHIKKFLYNIYIFAFHSDTSEGLIRILNYVILHFKTIR